MFGIEVSLAAFLVGAVVGMTGVGGGALMMPILVLVFGVPAQLAVGTDLLFAAITGWLVHHLGADSHRADRFVLTAVAVMLIVTALGLLAKNRLHDVGRRLRLGSSESFKRVQPGATVLAGALLGTVVTLTSVGAGALGAAILTCLYPLRLTPAKLVGTDLMHAIPIALVAGLGYSLMGRVDWALLGWMLAGSVPGVLLGSHWATRVSGNVLRPVLAVFLAGAGAKLLF